MSGTTLGEPSRVGGIPHPCKGGLGHVCPPLPSFHLHTFFVIVQGVVRSGDRRWQAFSCQGPVAGSPRPRVLFRSTPPSTWYTQAALTMPCRLFEDLTSYWGTRQHGGGDRP